MSAKNFMSYGDAESVFTGFANAIKSKANNSDLGTAAAKDSTNAVTAGSTDLVESGAVKDAIDAAVAAAYHHAGTKTVAQLTHDLLIASNEGNVYNITDSGTTTSDFIEGIGKTIDEGSNVGICKVGNAYMFDLLSGFVDTTNFVQKSQTAGLLKNDGTVNDKIEGDVSAIKSGLAKKEPLGGTTNGNKIFYVGDKLYFRTDDEGGNIVIKSPTNIAYEADAYNGSLRFYTARSGTVKSITWDGLENISLNDLKKYKIDGKMIQYLGSGNTIIDVSNVINIAMLSVANYQDAAIFMIYKESETSIFTQKLAGSSTLSLAYSEPSKLILGNTNPSAGTAMLTYPSSY